MNYQCVTFTFIIYAFVSINKKSVFRVFISNNTIRDFIQSV